MELRLVIIETLDEMMFDGFILCDMCVCVCVVARDPSSPTFPVQLRNLCHSFYQVVVKRFPDEAAAALGTVLFLRFVNPTLGNNGQQMASHNHACCCFSLISLQYSFFVLWHHRLLVLLLRFLSSR